MTVILQTPLKFHQYAYCRVPSSGTPSAARTDFLELLLLCRYLNPGFQTTVDSEPTRQVRINTMMYNLRVLMHLDCTSKRKAGEDLKCKVLYRRAMVRKTRSATLLVRVAHQQPLTHPEKVTLETRSGPSAPSAKRGRPRAVLPRR